MTQQKRETYSSILRRHGVSMPIEAWNEPPHVQWDHVDGPLLTWRGGLHWLTWRERFAIWRGKATPQSIAENIWYEESPGTPISAGRTS